jgi:hypothetical protein
MSQNSPYRNSFTIEKKLEIIEAYYEKYNQNAAETARNSKVDSSMISRWVKNKNLLEAYSGKKMLEK